MKAPFAIFLSIFMLKLSGATSAATAENLIGLQKQAVKIQNDTRSNVVEKCRVLWRSLILKYDGVNFGELLLLKDKHNILPEEFGGNEQKLFELLVKSTEKFAR